MSQNSTPTPSKVLKPTIYGWGINDLSHSYPRGCGGSLKEQPWYTTWRCLIQRTKDDKYKTRHYDYCGESTICDEWQYLSVFRDWVFTQKWEGRTLDKDILFYGNKHYSPETCIFVPGYLNSFIAKGPPSKNGCPIGARRHSQKNLYKASVSDRRSGRRVDLGYFKTPEEAHLKWQEAKLRICKQYVEDFKDEPRLYQGLCRIRDKLIFDIENRLITKHL